MTTSIFTALTLYALTMIILLVISAIAYAKAPKDARLPMQWGIDGQVNWSAPIRLAVLIIPLIALVTIGMTIAIMLYALPADDVPPATHTLGAVLVGLPLIIIHIGHLYFALRHIQKNND